MLHSKKLLISLFFLSIIIITGCSGSRIQRVTGNPEKISALADSAKYPFVKLHLRDGGVYILNKWNIDLSAKNISGTGKYLNADRQVINSGILSVPIDQVILAETNQIKNPDGFIALGAITILSTMATAACISFPKACFGSCPTFYADNGKGFEIYAEGFSSSISPCLEAADIDALYHFQPQSDVLQMRLKNEAYETHMIRSADVIAVPRPEGTNIFVTPDGRYYSASNIISAIEASGPEGDISQKVCSFDWDERFSSADSFDLSQKEIIELTFNNSDALSKGLILGGRQTLLTTYLFYQSLAYMGTTAGEWLARLERSDKELQKKINHPGGLLGYIEVLAQDSSGSWVTVGQTGETGPISRDIKIVPLNMDLPGNEVKIRLRMTKGLWRLDYIALADIGEEISPLLIPPTEAYPSMTEGSNVIELLTNTDSLLINYPGDEYLLHYNLPQNYKHYDYFLQTRGYYLEWMRNEWFAEENSGKVMQMLLNPNQYLKDLAPEFKKVEVELERAFWSSKYVNP